MPLLTKAKDSRIIAYLSAEKNTAGQTRSYGLKALDSFNLMNACFVVSFVLRVVIISIHSHKSLHRLSRLYKKKLLACIASH